MVEGYDCECIAGAYFEERVTSQEFFTAEEIMSKALPSCVNTPKYAYETYLSCLSWATPMHKDTDEFCSCYGNAMARNFQNNPMMSAREKEGIMALAMGECKVLDPVVKVQEHEKIKGDLQKKGKLESLFPGLFDEGK